MDPAAGPALPWAAQPHRSSPPPTDWPAQLRWQCGATRVELRWAVEEEEEEEDGADADAAAPAERVLWWGAVLDKRLDGRSDGEGRPAYQLLYDAGHGHEPEAHAVTFLDEHTCYHLELEDEVACRVEGDAWEPPSSPEDEQQALSMSEVHEQITRAERLRGKTAAQECSELLALLPPQQQREAASAFASLMEAIKRGVESKAPGDVVSEEDVHAWLRQQQGQDGGM